MASKRDTSERAFIGSIHIFGTGLILGILMLGMIGKYFFGLEVEEPIEILTIGGFALFGIACIYELYIAGP